MSPFLKSSSSCFSFVHSFLVWSVSFQISEAIQLLLGSGYVRSFFCSGRNCSVRTFEQRFLLFCIYHVFAGRNFIFGHNCYYYLRTVLQLQKRSRYTRLQSHYARSKQWNDTKINIYFIISIRSRIRRTFMLMCFRHAFSVNVFSSVYKFEWITPLFISSISTVHAICTSQRYEHSLINTHQSRFNHKFGKSKFTTMQCVGIELLPCVWCVLLCTISNVLIVIYAFVCTFSLHNACCCSLCLSVFLCWKLNWFVFSSLLCVEHYSYSPNAVSPHTMMRAFKHFVIIR